MTAFSSNRPDPILTDPVLELNGSPRSHGPHEPAAAPGEFDLEERQALRRVAGLSTELQDVTEVEYRSLRLEQASSGSPC